MPKELKLELEPRNQQVQVQTLQQHMIRALMFQHLKQFHTVRETLTPIQKILLQEQAQIPTQFLPHNQVMVKQLHLLEVLALM